MSEKRHCYHCGRDVTCREQPNDAEPQRATAVSLHCPECDRKLATKFGHVSIS